MDSTAVDVDAAAVGVVSGIRDLLIVGSEPERRENVEAVEDLEDALGRDVDLAVSDETVDPGRLKSVWACSISI